MSSTAMADTLKLKLKLEQERQKRDHELQAPQPHRPHSWGSYGPGAKRRPKLMRQQRKSPPATSTGQPRLRPRSCEAEINTSNPQGVSLRSPPLATVFPSKPRPLPRPVVAFILFLLRGTQKDAATT